MHENEIAATAAPKRIPWNKGKLIGPRPPLRQKHVWAIRTRLQIERQVRELALFNLAIDSKLRGCDLVASLHPRMHPGARFYMDNIPGADAGRQALVREANEVTVGVLHSRLFQLVIVAEYRRIDDAPHDNIPVIKLCRLTRATAKLSP
jgi:hypothetical protein